MQASLTGHLVLSTLHTNSAIGAVTRLLDMGVEGFLIASSLNGMLAQRLVRRLCSHCREPVSLEQRQRILLGVAEGTDVIVYKPDGCERCDGTGYRGRTGIFELIVVDDALRGLIHDGKGESEMLAHVRRRSASIVRGGVEKVLNGVTSIEEVLRVTREV